MARTTAIPDVRVGRFWRPDEDENAASGRLTLAEGASPRLELDEPLTPLMRKLDPT